MDAALRALEDRGSPTADTELAARSLAELVRNNLGLSFLNTLIGRLGQVVVGIVLARILVPEDYGFFAVALVTLNGLLSLNDLGVSLAIVRWPGDVRRFAPTVTTMVVVSSAMFYGVGYMAAPWLAATLGAPHAVGILRLLCLGVLVDGIVLVPAGLLSREFKQGRQLIVDLCSFAATAIVSLILATLGHGAWALAWGMLAGNIVTAVLILPLAPGRFRFGFDAGEARQLLRFGLPLAGSSLLVFMTFNLDYVIVGNALGPRDLGLYLLAFNIASWPVNMFSIAVRRVATAGFARLRDRPALLGSALARSMGLLLAVTIPICVLLSTLALPLLRFVYGDRWAPAAGSLMFLAGLGAVRVAVELAYDFLVAVGRSSTVLWLQAVWVVALAPALLLGVAVGGIGGVALAHLVVAVGLMVPAFLYALHQYGVNVVSLAGQCARPLLGAGVIAAAAWAVQALAIGDFWQLAVGGTVASALYVLVVLPLRGAKGGGRPSPNGETPVALETGV